MISIPKGMKDVLPADSAKWQFVEELFRKTAEKYGFTEIRTPMVEHTELFARGIGDTTDVVQKEMYTFEISERSLTLKPEGTAGVVRSFIENKLYAEGLPAKYYYITPCYRYEKMQQGRQREFHQFGIELFGSSNMLADAEVCFGMFGFQVVKAKRLCRDLDIQADVLVVRVTALAHVFFKLNDCLSHGDILLCRPLVRTRGVL